VPAENADTTGGIAKSAVTRQPGVVSDLKDFIGACAQVKKAVHPDTLRANVGKFIGELDDDSKGLLNDLAGLFRRPK
jgi:hypothetical protein